MIRTGLRSAVVLAAIAGFAAVVVTSGAGSVKAPRTAAAPTTTCHLGNGIQHVINIVFDNVHFSRDNPNVPSDLEQMPTLLNFLKSNGTVFSNSHTPMIAHTADDSLTIYTGLYGDRHGQPVSNSFKTYNPDGSTDPATSFTYWTSPIIDTRTNPPAANTVDTTPSMAYSGGGVTPAPGMYVVGLQFLRRRKSAFIDGAAADAADLSAHLASYLAHPASGRIIASSL